MNVISKNIIQNKIKNIQQTIFTEVKNTPNDTVNITPYLNYVKDLPPSNLPSTKKKNLSNVSPNHFYDIYDHSSSINNAYFDINNVTINNNTNLTNLNLYFLYNSENPDYSNKKNKRKINLKNVIFPKEKEPVDTIRKKVYFKKLPIDAVSSRENKYKRNHSIKYKIKRISSKSPMNNTHGLFNTNNKVKDKYTYDLKEKSNIREINEIKDNNDYPKEDIEPRGKINLNEFTLISQIGKGTFGKIYAVMWKKNGKNYAIKKEVFNDFEYVKTRQNIEKLINEFLFKTKNKGVIEIYSHLCEKGKDDYFNYYELMEMGERDLENEINRRRNTNSYYTEKELFNMASQLITTLALLQKNHITHRDIKPQNILIVNGHYKLCDFGEIRIMKREGVVVQRIRGSELYMSPILFYGLRENMIQVKHNTYKSDVFSLGMCLLYAATMYFNCTDEIREIIDMNEIKMILNKYLGDRYSNKFISLIHLMLQVEEQHRPDFIQLEEKLNNLLIV